jgi:hypothetical protein
MENDRFSHIFANLNACNCIVELTQTNKKLLAKGFAVFEV